MICNYFCNIKNIKIFLFYIEKKEIKYKKLKITEKLKEDSSK